LLPILAARLPPREAALVSLKRRLAPDVSTVVIYATRPSGRIVGTFQVLGHDVASPGSCGTDTATTPGSALTATTLTTPKTAAAVGILIGSVQPLPRPRHLTELPRPTQALAGVGRPSVGDLRTMAPRRRLGFRERLSVLVSPGKRAQPLGDLLSRDEHDLCPQN
jgi:predicted transcriptional regulator